MEGDPRPRRRWAQPGKVGTVPYLGDHVRQNVIGVVCPASGQLFSLIVEGVDTDVLQAFLDQFGGDCAQAAGGAAIADSGQCLVTPGGPVHWHHFEPWYLPGYSRTSTPLSGAGCG